MIVQYLTSFQVTGFSLRTKNADEMNPSTAKIGQLWEKFYTEAYPKLTSDSKVYGVYTHYESDATGAFDVIACADTLQPSMFNDAIPLSIASGNYLKFSATGTLPQAVIELWEQVWHYFSASNCPHTRAYTTDFEYYKSDNEVEIFIALR